MLTEGQLILIIQLPPAWWLNRYSRNGWNCPRYGHASGKTTHHTPYNSNSKPNNRLNSKHSNKQQQIQQQQMQQAQPVQQMQQAQLVQQMQPVQQVQQVPQVQPVQQVPHVQPLAPPNPVYTPAPPIAAAPVNTPSVATIPAPLPQIPAQPLTAPPLPTVPQTPVAPVDPKKNADPEFLGVAAKRGPLRKHHHLFTAAGLWLHCNAGCYGGKWCALSGSKIGQARVLYVLLLGCKLTTWNPSCYPPSSTAPVRGRSNSFSHRSDITCTSHHPWLWAWSPSICSHPLPPCRLYLQGGWRL